MDRLSSARGCLYGILGGLVLIAVLLLFADWVIHVVD